MRINRIDLDDEGQPESVTATLSADEALFLAVVTGKHSSNTAEELMIGGGRLSSSVYGCLAGSLFNRFYEDGVDDALRHRG